MCSTCKPQGMLGLGLDMCNCKQGVHGLYVVTCLCHTLSLLLPCGGAGVWAEALGEQCVEVLTYSPPFILLIYLFQL